MSSCSAEEIAEKKRIALEKLQAKKAFLNKATNSMNTSSNNNNNSIGTLSKSNKLLTSPPQLPPKPVTTSIAKHISPTSKIILPNKQTKNFYHKEDSNSCVPTKSAASNGNGENKASTFLNALKQSSFISHRKEARDSAHPYQRNSTIDYLNNITKAPLVKKLSPQKHLAPVFVKTVTGKVYVTSTTRFAVQPSGYHSKLIEIFKSIPTKNYDNSTRIWTFALKEYQLVQDRVAALKPDVVIGVIPKNVLKLCQLPPKDIDRSCLNGIESTLSDKLLPFQRDGVCFAVAQHGRILICDEMGLGKTYQALAVADFYKEDWPLLICTTASTRESWAGHVRQLLPNIPLHYVQVLTNNQQYIGDAKILITSYNMMEKQMTELMARKFGFLIFDESHTLKNQKAKCTIVADRLSVQAKHVVLLSGTPALSRPAELFSQLRMIDRKFMNFMDYTSRYCDGKQTNFGWDANGQSNLQELNVVLKLKYMIRRTKAEVLPQLAEKNRETVVLDPALVWSNDDTKEALNVFSKNLLASKGKEKEEILLRFYAETAKVKTRSVCAYLQTVVKENIKFIVFAHHRVMIDAICDCLFKLKTKFVKIDGSTKNDLRAEYIDTFQNKSSCKVAVLSLKACNSGITLTAAELIIFAELDWNPSTLAQAESRAHRIGQEKTVICRYLMASKTADDVIWNMLKAKQDVLNKAGLFCENLQDATHTICPTISNKINNYFASNSAENSKPASPKVTTKMDTNTTTADQNVNQSNNTESNKELKNMEAFFKDDDDAAFMDLEF